MLGRTYSVQRNAVATSTAITIIQLAVPSTALVELIAARCSQSSSTTSAQNRIQILRKTVAATVAAATPAPLGTNFGASLCVGGAALTGITATAEGTDGQVLVDEGFNVLNGWLWLPPLEDRIIVRPSEIIALKFPAAPANATWSAQLDFIEY